MRNLGLGDLGFLAAVSGVAYDSDALAYMTAVEAADGQALETGVKDAIDAFVRGCKTDGIWTAIKASCILAGARTLGGALVPLVGAAPTNFNFAAGDYDRKMGLVGDGNTKHLSTNRAENADPLTSKHISVYATTHHTRNVTRADLGDPTGNQDSQLLTAGTARFFRVNTSISPDPTIGDTTSLPGFWGASRSETAITGRYGNTVYSFQNTVSGSAGTQPTYVFSRGSAYSNARLAFYSIGEALNLALLDARVTTLINALAAAIP